MKSKRIKNEILDFIMWMIYFIWGGACYHFGGCSGVVIGLLGITFGEIIALAIMFRREHE